MLNDITNLPARDDILIRERALELAIEHTSSTGGHPLSYADGFENYIRSGETPFNRSQEIRSGSESVKGGSSTSVKPSPGMADPLP